MNTAGASRALVGARRLLSWENGTADGDVTYPIGPDPLRYLIYADTAASRSLASSRLA